MERGARRNRGASVPGQVVLTSQRPSTLTKDPQLFLSRHPSLPAVLLIEAFSLPAPLQKNLTNMLCEISELIRPNGAHICHWLFWERAACVMEGILLTN